MADLTCQEVVELVTDYLEGVLDHEAVARFEQHLATCAGCETYLDQMRQTVARLGRIPIGTLSSEMRSRLLAAFRDFHR